MPRRPNPLNPASSPLAYFGSELRIYRDRLKLSQDQAAARSNYSGSYVGAVERAEEMPDLEFAEAMDEGLQTGGALRRLWLGLLQPSVYPTWFDWPKHETEALALRTAQLALVYGLLQTEEYAAALLYEDKVAVQARLARQRILTRTDPKPPLLVCVLDECVLHHEVGSPQIMREQLRYLIDVVSERIAVHVIRSKRHRGVAGSFVLATRKDRSEVAYVETAARGITTGEPLDLTTLNERFESVRSQALPQDQSLELIERTAKERWS